MIKTKKITHRPPRIITVERLKEEEPRLCYQERIKETLANPNKEQTINEQWIYAENKIKKAAKDVIGYGKKIRERVGLTMKIKKVDRKSRWLEKECCKRAIKKT